jgi:hypothetical protein
MKLINCTTLRIEEFFGSTASELYAILSHRWEDDEVTYQEAICTQAPAHKAGWTKIREACRVAHSMGYEYAWVDTVCINKQDLTELTEAINSMFKWYANAAVCLAYLSDVDPGQSSIENSLWFTRGWTLQEASCPPEPPCCPPDGTPTAGSRKNGTGPKRLSPPHGHGSPNQPVRVAPSPSPPKPAKWHPVAPVCGAW